MSKDLKTSSSELLQPIVSPIEKKSKLRWWLVVLPRRLLLGIFGFFLIYAAFLLIGLVPINSETAVAHDGIPITIISTAVHADIVVPLKNGIKDWSKDFPDHLFKGSVSDAAYVLVGWGDKGFYLETPTWSELKVSTAAKALLLPSSTCMHVSLKRNPRFTGSVAQVHLSEVQYAKLVQFIESSFQRDGRGSMIPIPGVSYGTDDVFFEATGKYHCFNTCNSWVGRAMQASGLKTPWQTPLPNSMFLYLPKEALDQ